MPAWSVTIRTPIKEERKTIRGPFKAEAEVLAFVESQQSVRMSNSGLPAMPAGEVVEVRRAVWPDDFKKRPAAFAINDPATGPALCK